jgi:hypothetical protein
MYQRIDEGSEKTGKFEPPPLDVEQTIALLQSWYSNGPQEQQEQRETWQYLKQTLDEDRTSDRKLFP